jgi:hypothetical protein
MYIYEYIHRNFSSFIYYFFFYTSDFFVVIKHNSFLKEIMNYITQGLTTEVGGELQQTWSKPRFAYYFFSTCLY